MVNYGELTPCNGTIWHPFEGAGWNAAEMSNEDTELLLNAAASL